MTIPAKYLVQARSHGAPWQTWHVTPTREQAEALADVLAAQMAGDDWPQLHLHPFVRVTYKGSVVYGPRDGRTVAA